MQPPRKTDQRSEQRSGSTGALAALSRAEKVGMAVASLLPILLMFAVIIGVLARSTGRSIGPILEWGEYAILWGTLLAAPYVLRTDGHVKMEVMQEFVGAQVTVVLDVIATILVAGICYVVAAAGVWVIFVSYSRGSLSPGVAMVPQWAVLSVIPLGFLLLALRSTASLPEMVNEARRRHHHPEDSA